MEQIFIKGGLPLKKSVKITSLVCAAALLVSSVLSPASTVVHAKAKKPALSKKKLSVKIGKTAKLSVKRAKGWKISWKSKNKKTVQIFFSPGGACSLLFIESKSEKAAGRFLYSL